MIVEGRVGPINIGDGSQQTARLAKTGELVVVDAHGRYYESTIRNTMFSGSITGQVTTVGLATTYTGLCLSNPVGSTVNLAINKVGYAFTVAFAAVSVIGLATGYNSTTNVIHTTPVTPRNQKFTGASGGVGLLDSACTLPLAPTLNMILNAGSTATAAVPPLVSGLVDLEGSIILPPGAYCILYTSSASGAAGGSFSFQWEEVTNVV